MAALEFDKGRLLLRQDTSLLAIAIVSAACNGGASKADASSEAPEIASARAMIAGDAGLPARADALVVAEGVEARANKESGARAVELHALAGSLFERMYRLEGKDQDAKEAMAAFDSASKDLKEPGACDAAMHGAALAGDAAHDAQSAFIAFYKLSRRLGFAGDAGDDANACAGRANAAMGSLEAFRPPPRVLEAIDRGLEAQGVMPEVDASAPHGGAFVDRVEHWPGKDAARVVITLSRDVHFRTSDEPQANGTPQRIVIDVDGAALGAHELARAARDASGIVTRVRVSTTTTGARVTLDLDSGTVYKRVFNLPEPFRIVVDVARRPPRLDAEHRRTVSRVVLDPGHGGYDSGATGPTGLKEKDVTLEIAKRTKPILASAGMDVVLTRDDDRFVTLEERTARANQLGADLFVSIHCNAAPTGARHGVETYVLDTTRDEIAQRVAARENGASAAATAELGSILANMRLADQATHSTRLAELLQKSAMASIHPVHPDTLDGGVHYAGFYVLVGARMPAVLFETSYISNAAEEQRLADDDYKGRLADAIANAIRAYREGR
jgi:N-acetylmuramoyl-L-alanine amidase